VKLAIPEMLAELAALREEADPLERVAAAGAEGGRAFLLMAGERRSYNANQIYRDPAWRKVDPHGALRMHPDDAAALGVVEGGKVVCASARDALEVVVELDDGLRRGVVTLPHGYGQRYRGGAPAGPELNRLTDRTHCDPLSKTPYHKHVPVWIRPAA
jgi:anaerobic selenocysteine-containing dehydrogenase